MDTPLSDDNDDLAEDLLEGAGEIATFMGPKWNRRKVFYAAERQILPIFRMGSRLCARKSKIRKRIEEREQAAERGGGTEPGAA